MFVCSREQLNNRLNPDSAAAFGERKEGGEEGRTLGSRLGWKERTKERRRSSINESSG